MQLPDYIGSSTLGLEKVEHNHRNAGRLLHYGEPYTITEFRSLFVEEYDRGYFKWLISPFKCTEAKILKMEQDLIQKHYPVMNQCYNPFDRKEAWQLNTRTAKKIRFRGVYGWFDSIDGE